MRAMSVCDRHFTNLCLVVLVSAALLGLVSQNFSDFLMVFVVVFLK